MTNHTLPILALIEQLKQSDRRPSPEVNSLFSTLVALALDESAGQEALSSLTPAEQQQLHTLCSDGESKLETAWAQQIATSATPVHTLRAFPYFDNYLKMTGYELATIQKHLPNRHIRAVFVGSGPLPISPLLYSQSFLFETVHGIDYDQAALEAGQQVSRQLKGNLEFQVGNAETFDFQSYDVICVAALVGMTDAAKQAILASIRTTAQPGALVTVRSVHGARQLLYPKLESTPEGYQEIACFIPKDDVVNSLHVLKIKEVI